MASVYAGGELPCNQPLPDEPRQQGLSVLTAGFLCALSAASMSMVFPSLPSVNNIIDLVQTSVPGFDKDLGVEVLSRPQPLFEPGGIHAGSFVVQPALDESTSYDTNVLGSPRSPSSAILHTAPSLAVNSDWSRNRLGGYISLDNGTYFDTPKQSRTDWTAAVGGGLTIGRGEATLAVSHITGHEDGTDIGAIASSTPVPYSVNDLRSDYTMDLGRLRLTPNIDLSQWRYGTTTIAGLPSDQSYRDRDVLQAGVAARFQTGEEWSLLFTAAAINAHYVHPLPGVPPPTSNSFLAMGGFDYQFTGNLRVRLLAGLEAREFTSAAYSSRVAPVARATAIWTPTQTTTVTGTLMRTIEDPAQEDTGGLTYSRAELELDHEYLRNVILRGRVGVQSAEYLQNGGTQTSVYTGLGVTWLINRNIRLLADYQFISQSAASGTSVPFNPNSLIPGAYTRNIIMLRLHVTS